MNREGGTRLRRVALGATSFVLVASGFAGALGAGLSVVRRAEVELLRAETSMAVAVASAPGGRETVDAWLGDRVRITAEVDDLLDQAVVSRQRGDGGAERGLVGRAALYEEDGWTRAGTLELRPASETGEGLPAVLVLVALVALAAVLGVCHAWVRRAAGGSGAFGAVPSWVPPLALALVLAPGVWLGGRWAEGRLAALTDVRLDRAVESLRLAGDDAPLEQPGWLAQRTGLPFLLREVGTPPGDAPSFSPLLPATRDALAALPSPPPARVRIGRVPYAVRDAGRARLAALPFEHTLDPRAAMVALALAGLGLAGLPVLLAPLVGHRRRFRRNLVAWGFLAPAGLHLAVFTFGPLAFAAWLSLHEWTLVDAARPFVALDNYRDLLSDGEFWTSIRNTAVFTLHVPASMAVALTLALLLRGQARTLRLVRMLVFLPGITSLVAIAIVWQWMLNDQYGLANWLLSFAGLGPVRWLSSPSVALVSIMIVSIWVVVGYQMVLFQAGLATIARELYDAARIDGAGRWRRFVHVTVPGLRHTLFFVLVTSVIGSFQVFAIVYVMTEGGPLGATDVAVFHIYREAWEFLRFGSAAAMSWILFAVIFAVTWLHFRVLERRTEAAP